MKEQSAQTNYTVEIYPPEQQGSGAFDGGKITEIKPIPFPQESGGSRRVGPLLYWAWASARGDGVIGMHPHQGFEIISYVMEGAVGHTDTAGNNRRVGAGGIQLMQTGSGISHQEEMYGERTEFFQIWFEPNMRESLQKPPVYLDFKDSDFPREQLETGATLKRIIGPHGVTQIDAPAVWDEVQIDSNGRYTNELAEKSLAALVVTQGKARLTIGDDAFELNRRDFALVKTETIESLILSAIETGATATLITAPLDPGYPLVRI